MRFSWLIVFLMIFGAPSMAETKPFVCVNEKTIFPAGSAG